MCSAALSPVQSPAPSYFSLCIKCMRGGGGVEGRVCLRHTDKLLLQIPFVLNYFELPSMSLFLLRERVVNGSTNILNMRAEWNP
jgi:hypothetical protein